MNVEQIKQLMLILRAEYGNKVVCTEERVNVWQVVLAHSSYNEAQLAVAKLLSEARAFPPSVGEINQEVIKGRKAEAVDWSELWNTVAKAGARSLYYAEEEAAKLSPEALKAIGGTDGLKEIAKSTPEHIAVIRAQFRQRLEVGTESQDNQATRKNLLRSLPKINVNVKEIG